jgi:hypothetical protein
VQKLNNCELLIFKNNLPFFSLYEQIIHDKKEGKEREFAISKNYCLNCSRRDIADEINWLGWLLNALFIFSFIMSY